MGQLFTRDTIMLYASDSLTLAMRKRLLQWSVLLEKFSEYNLYLNVILMELKISTIHF